MSGNRVLSIAIAILLFSCSDEPSEIGNVFKSGDVSYGIAFVDTLTVRTSTVLLDSLPTSWTGTLLTGRYQDSKFGTVQSTAYLQLGPSTGWTPDTDALFDSVVLILPVNGIYYGDTTATSTLSVHQVTEDFATHSLPLYWTDEGNYPYFNATSGLFNTSEFVYASSALGTKTFKPRPNSADTLKIRLSDNLGSSWMQEAKQETNFFRSYTEFHKYFQGLGITETSATAGSVLGFDASGAKIRIYYREYSSGVLESTYFDLTYTTLYYQYNKISSDRTNTPLASLQPGNKILSSELTDNEAYMQAGVGIVTKVEFPYIKDLYNVNNILLINSAVLVIEPVHGTYSATRQLPFDLTLFHTNETNVPLSPVYGDYSDDIQYATISFDEEFGTTTGYNFSITQYMQSLFSSTYSGKPALLVATPISGFRNSVTRVCFGGGDHPDYKMKLKIHYTYKK
jgi:hypothetical protein